MIRDAERQMQRLLHCLRARPRTVAEAAEADRLRLEAADGAPIVLPRQTVREAVSRGLVRLEGGRIALSDAGRAAALRSDAGADAHAAQHQERIAINLPEADGGRVTVNLAESPLAQIARRRGRDGRAFLATDEVAAGERLRVDFTKARIAPRLGINWDAPTAGGRRSGPGSGMGDLTDAALDARRRVEGAIFAVGPELSGVLLDICCFLKGLEEVERERNWPVRSAKLMLKAALGTLARHYDPARPRRASVVHWGAEGYRPTLT